ncbi:MAG: hypothetical protein VKL59_02895 [Nostocaceae cyanobacterium]|nr:hypothetical protein [Nostocaceae cyanobacterium]
MQRLYKIPETECQSGKMRAYRFSLDQAFILGGRSLIFGHDRQLLIDAEFLCLFVL